MGKPIIAQKRGKGSSTYRAHSFRFKGKAKNPRLAEGLSEGKITDLINCKGHSAPLAEVIYDNGEKCLMIAPEGIRVGDSLKSGEDAPAEKGNCLPLINIPEGSLIFNIESMPGDGGKFCRSSGTFARVVAKLKSKVIVQLPSKKQKEFNPNCRAVIGVTSGGGRPEKPILKAGNKYYKMKAKNKLWPKVSGSAMNAVSHPFGNARSSRKSKAKPVSRHAPPGKKVGMIAAKRTGRKKK